MIMTCGDSCPRCNGSQKTSLKKEILSKKPIRKEIIVLAAGIILFISGLLTEKHEIFSGVLFSLSWFVTGIEVLKHAVFNIVKGQVFDENLLMTIATLGAFAIGEYPEAAAVMLFYKVGMILEETAVERSRKSIADLVKLRPEKANLKTESGIMEVNAEEIQAGDILLVRPGERVPVDSVIIEGETVVDTSSLTGESLPKSVGEGDRVLGGYVNKIGLITVKAEGTLKQSAVSRILELVEEAVSRKSSAESFIRKFSMYYTPAVTVAALLTAVLPPIVTGSMDFGTWVYRAMIFLVISCPCALVVSIPLTYFAGIGRASSRGILVKGSNYLEALNNIDTVVFDKTGTLTEGVFEVSGYSPSGCTEEELLEYAAYAEANSAHPIAQSILRAYGKKINLNLIESFEEFAGRGVKATVGGHLIIAGNFDFVTSCGITPEAGENEPSGTDVYVAVDNAYKGRISVSDALKKDAFEAVKKLRDRKIRRIAMLTGDSRRPAETIAEKLGLDEFHYNLLPHNKVELFEEIKSKSKGTTIFAGDGINDAPVLAVADIGVSMGGIGSDAAIEASDVVLMTDEPGKISEAIDIAVKTRKIALQNIVLAITVKVLVLLLGTAGTATMWGAVVADVGVTLVTVLNSMRVRYGKI